MEIDSTPKVYIPRIMVKRHLVSAARGNEIKTMAFKNDIEGVIGLKGDSEDNTVIWFGVNDTATKIEGIKGSIHDMIYFPLYKSYFAWCLQDKGLYQIREDQTVRCIVNGVDNVNFLTKVFRIYGKYLFVNWERGFKIYSGLNNPEPKVKVVKLEHKNSVAFYYNVLSDNRILILSPNSLLLICDWEGKNILEYKTPEQEGYCRSMTYFQGSNEFVLHYITRLSEKTSLDWFSISKDNNDIQLEGRLLKNRVGDEWKFDGILLTHSSRHNKLLLPAWNMLAGKVQFFTRDGNKVYECSTAAHFDIQYTFQYNEDTNRIWLANKDALLKEWVIR